jgi:probable addiction module antidote protein
MTRKSPSSRNQSKMIASILNDALVKGDTVAFVKAIGVIRAQGVTEVSQKTGLNRPTLYKSFRGDIMMPNIDRVIRTLAALELEIVVRPIHQS